MNRIATENLKKMSFAVPVDVHETLARWAADNMTSMNAETVRAVRERAQRELREKAAG